MTFEGKWDINKIEYWDEDDLVLGEPPYIFIDSDNTGYFQFGLINGDISFKSSKDHDIKIREFSFSANYGFEEVSGRGWMRIINDGLEGVFKFEDNDSVEFYAGKGNFSM